MLIIIAKREDPNQAAASVQPRQSLKCCLPTQNIDVNELRPKFRPLALLDMSPNLGL